MKLIQKSFPAVLALVLSGALLTASYRSLVAPDKIPTARAKAAASNTVAAHQASNSDLHPSK